MIIHWLDFTIENGYGPSNGESPLSCNCHEKNAFVNKLLFSTSVRMYICILGYNCLGSFSFELYDLIHLLYFSRAWKSLVPISSCFALKLLKYKWTAVGMETQMHSHCVFRRVWWAVFWSICSDQVFKLLKIMVHLS